MLTYELLNTKRCESKEKMALLSATQKAIMFVCHEGVSDLQGWVFFPLACEAVSHLCPTLHSPRAKPDHFCPTSYYLVCAEPAAIGEQSTSSPEATATDWMVSYLQWTGNKTAGSSVHK